MRPPRPSSGQGPGILSQLLAKPTDRVLLLYLLLVLSTTTYVLVDDSDTPNSSQLRIWLIVNAALASVRTLGRVAMRVFPTDRWPILRRCCIWFLRLASIAALSWFLLGIFFLHEDDENGRKSSHIPTLVTAIIAVELAVLCSSILLCLIIFLFALQPVLNGRHGAPAATEEDLSKLRLFKFSKDDVVENGNDTEMSCSICLCDYEDDDVLRELPCAVGRHVFHAECVDEWLMQKLSCPICRDDPLGRSDPEPEQQEAPPEDEQA